LRGEELQVAGAAPGFRRTGSPEDAALQAAHRRRPQGSLSRRATIAQSIVGVTAESERSLAYAGRGPLRRFASQSRRKRVSRQHRIRNRKVNPCATLHRMTICRRPIVIHRVSRCATMIRQETSRTRVQNARAPRALEPHSKEQPQPRTSPDDARRFAIKVAIDAEGYERASALLEILRCAPKKEDTVTRP
jgi:hypothetical protein